MEKEVTDAAAVGNNDQTVAGAGKCPGSARRTRAQKRRMVAGRPGHLGSSPELQLVRPLGRWVRLCQGV
jgi:hypothetical protein